MKDRLKYVIDSRYFDGTCLTSMSDGFHNDYGEETIEELRIRENNPYLKAVTPSDIDKKLRLYHQSLSEPFKEITEARLIPYYFSLDGKHPVFICNLVIQSDSRQARTDMANTLKSLRRNHFQFYKGKGHYETPDELIDHVSGKKLTLVSDGHFFQYPPGRESATFIGHIKETSEEFLFRIYDREYFLYLLKRLRTVKKESAQEQINIKS